MSDGGACPDSTSNYVSNMAEMKRKNEELLSMSEARGLESAEKDRVIARDYERLREMTNLKERLIGLEFAAWQNANAAGDSTALMICEQLAANQQTLSDGQSGIKQGQRHLSDRVAEKVMKPRSEDKKARAKIKSLELKNQELEANSKEVDVRCKELEVKNREFEAKNQGNDAKFKQLEANMAEMERKNEELLSMSKAQGLESAEKDSVIAEMCQKLLSLTDRVTGLESAAWQSTNLAGHGTNMAICEQLAANQQTLSVGQNQIKQGQQHLSDRVTATAEDVTYLLPLSVEQTPMQMESDDQED